MNQVQYGKNSVSTGLWLPVNVGTVQETIVNIGFWFDTKFRVEAPFMVNISPIIFFEGSNSSLWKIFLS